MFLFLSKLLPLLVYPLGIACLLIGVAIVTLWKRPRVAAVCLATALGVLLLFSNGTFSRWLVRSLEWQHLPAADLPQAEAIVVLGGSTRPAIAPRPWIDVQEAGDRPLHAARLYLNHKAPHVILSGGRIPWGPTATSEADDMAQIVQAMGVPDAAIIKESRSRNTRENAVNVQKILLQKDIQTILLVTSAIHMPRALKIFEKLGIEAIAAPTDFLTVEGDQPSGNMQGSLLDALPQAERLERSTRALKEYLGMVVYRLRGWL